MKIDAFPHSKLKKFYDEKYEKGYMGESRYSVWSHTDIQLLRVKETLEQVAITPRLILDYGCGQGAWIDVLSETFPESQLWGIDISDVAIEKAQTRFPKYHFSSFDGTKAPLPDSSFDLIYSYHVLEHVSDVEACISDISRMIKKDGYVCLIFPCGNRHSFEEKIMNLMENGKETSSAGGIVYFYETDIGHLRRMSSQETISFFNKNGLILVMQFYSNHFFGWVDWLTRGHFPRDINNMFLRRKPINFTAKLRLETTRRMLLVLNQIIGLKSLDVSKKRKLPKQTTAFAIKTLAKSIDRLVVFFAFLEWRFCRHRPNGSAQYLVFKKSSN